MRFGCKNLVLVVATGVTMLVSPSMAWEVGSGGLVEWEGNCDFYGNGYWYIPYTRSEDCGTICAAYETCSHWTWVWDEDGGGCYLKCGSTGKKTFDANMSCGDAICRFQPTP